MSYRILHLFFLPDLAAGRGFRTALGLLAHCTNKQDMIERVSGRAGRDGAYRMASSKTLFRFRCVRAEHSRYLCALISLATPKACS